MKRVLIEEVSYQESREKAEVDMEMEQKGVMNVNRCKVMEAVRKVTNRSGKDNKG